MGICDLKWSAMPDDVFVQFNVLFKSVESPFSIEVFDVWAWSVRDEAHYVLRECDEDGRIVCCMDVLFDQRQSVCCVRLESTKHCVWSFQRSRAFVLWSVWSRGAKHSKMTKWREWFWDEGVHMQHANMMVLGEGDQLKHSSTLIEEYMKKAQFFWIVRA